MKVGGEMGVCHTEWQGYGITIEQGVRRNQCSAGMWSNQSKGTHLGNLESTMNFVPTMWMLLSCCTFGNGSMLPGLDHNENG